MNFWGEADYVGFKGRMRVKGERGDVVGRGVCVCVYVWAMGGM